VLRSGGDESDGGDGDGESGIAADLILLSICSVYGIQKHTRSFNLCAAFAF